MKRLAAALLVTSFSMAAAAARDPAQESKIEHDVAAADPSLVSALHDGNAATDRGDDEAAMRAYAKVHAGAPKVADVTRRLCTAEARAGVPELGIKYCREALAEDASPENHAALAMALLANQPPQKRELEEAAQEAHAAVRLAPNAPFAQTTACEVAAAVGDLDALRACSAALRKIAPNAPTTHLFASLVMGHDLDIDAAEKELDAARAAGLSQSLYDQTRAALERARPTPHPVRDAILAVLSAWVALLFLVIVGGLLFGDLVSPRSGPVTRAAARAALKLATLAWWVSVPIVVVGAGLGLGLTVMAFLEIAQPSRAVEGVMAAVALYLVVALGRALFSKVPHEELGLRIDAGKKSSLRKLLDRAAETVEMPPVTAVYARPDAALEVVELGGPFGHLAGKNPRALVLGLAALEGMTQPQLAALVASELGRYRAGVAGGDLALVQRASFDASIERMEQRGVALDANPAWWFVRACRALLERISAGPLDVQEALADRLAARAFGGEALAGGLRHLAKREVEIDARARASLREALDGESAFDLYEREPDEDVRQEIDDVIASMEERLERIEAREDEGSEEVPDAPAWALFSDRKKLEREMLERVHRELRERGGFEIADQPSSASSVARA